MPGKADFNIKDFLAEQRARAGLSQRDLADKLGYDTPQFISNWERGVSLPPPAAIKTLAQEFGIDEAYLRRQVADFAIQETSQAILKRYQVH